MKIRLLSTVLLDQLLKDRAAGEGIELDDMSFIEVSTNLTEEQENEIRELFDLPVTAVFSSANAVRAVAAIFENNKPAWTIYCLSGATQQAVYDNFDIHSITTMNIANDAAALAEMIINDEVNEVVFFCGDKRMDTVPGMLSARDISVHEEIVYRTAETPKTVAKHYDGILFFSPSAVNSFFSVNKIDAGTVLFAIGDTTGSAIRAKTGSEAVTGKKHSKENLVEEAIQYFLKQAAVSR